MSTTESYGSLDSTTEGRTIMPLTLKISEMRAIEVQIVDNRYILEESIRNVWHNYHKSGYMRVDLTLHDSVSGNLVSGRGVLLEVKLKYAPLYEPESCGACRQDILEIRAESDVVFESKNTSASTSSSSSSSSGSSGSSSSSSSNVHVGGNGSHVVETKAKDDQPPASSISVASYSSAPSSSSLSLSLSSSLSSTPSFVSVPTASGAAPVVSSARRRFYIDDSGKGQYCSDVYHQALRTVVLVLVDSNFE
jgi:hypothetical protein